MLRGKSSSAKATILRHHPFLFGNAAHQGRCSLSAIVSAAFALMALLVWAPSSVAQIARNAPGVAPATIALADSGEMRNGTRLAGLAITLAPDYKTYWRTPGDSGLPPVFDWSKSKNIRQVDVLWPVPQRFDDQAGSSIGYEGSLLLPLAVRIADPSQEAELSLSLSFGVCKTICIPAKGEAVISLRPGATPTSAAPAIARALSLVPVAAQLDSGALPGILSAKFVKDGMKWALEAETVVPEGRKIVDLFVEGPDSWLFGASVPIVSAKAERAGAQRIVYRAALEDVPPGFSFAGTKLILTLAADREATETSGTLDAAGVLH